MNENINYSRGFVYVTFGDKFLKEAAESANRVKRIHNYPILLITDQEVADYITREAFDEVIIRDFKHEYSDKIFMKESPFDKTIFLDSDTIVQQSMDPLFEMLDYFDIAVQFTEGGNHYKLPGVPTCFYEPSAGIIAWKKSKAIARFFDDWSSYYEKIQQEQGQVGAWDQRSLRNALYFNRDIRIVPLPIEWQFYTYRPNIAAGPIVMVHGRRINNHMLHSINASTEFRVWIPKVGYVPHFSYASISEICKFIFGLLKTLLRLSIRRSLAALKIWKVPLNKRPA